MKKKHKEMHQQNHMFIFFIAFYLFSLCFGSFHENPLPVSQYYDQFFGHYPRLASLYTFRNTDFRSSMTTKMRRDRGSSLSGSPKIVNVDDFGAKGNGQDDSEVETSCIMLTTRPANLQAVVPESSYRI